MPSGMLLGQWEHGFEGDGGTSPIFLMASWP